MCRESSLAGGERTAASHRIYLGLPRCVRMSLHRAWVAERLQWREIIFGRGVSMKNYEGLNVSAVLFRGLKWVMGIATLVVAINIQSQAQTQPGNFTLSITIDPLGAGTVTNVTQPFQPAGAVTRSSTPAPWRHRRNRFRSGPRPSACCSERCTCCSRPPGPDDDPGDARSTRRRSRTPSSRNSS